MARCGSAAGRLGRRQESPPLTRFDLFVLCHAAISRRSLRTAEQILQAGHALAQIGPVAFELVHVACSDANIDTIRLPSSTPLVMMPMHSEALVASNVQQRCEYLPKQIFDVVELAVDASRQGVAVVQQELFCSIRSGAGSFPCDPPHVHVGPPCRASRPCVCSVQCRVFLLAPPCILRPLGSPAQLGQLSNTVAERCGEAATRRGDRKSSTRRSFAAMAWMLSDSLQVALAG